MAQPFNLLLFAYVMGTLPTFFVGLNRYADPADIAALVLLWPVWVVRALWRATCRELRR